GSNASKVIRSPESTAVNTWVTIRLEVIGARVRLLVDGVVIVDYVDPAPLSGGQPIVYHNDTFASASAPAGSVGGIFDRISVDSLSTLGGPYDEELILSDIIAGAA
ncbi:hypothetical protein RZS08_02755, partial [Arthrospira platensis SPKY1]|nr:hypothetical protein [Arthrospira platensis SPKY1]